MITHQLDANRDVADIPLSIPHAAAGMISHIFLIQNAIRTTVACNHIVGMTAAGASAITQTFAFRDDFKGGIEPELSPVDNNVFGLLAFDFLEPEV